MKSYTARSYKVCFYGTVLLCLVAEFSFYRKPILANSARTSQRETRKVLFIGNSYTHFNMLPSMVTRLARSTSTTMHFISQVYTKPGCTLQRHWKKRKAIQLINRGRFSHVVLQAHSLDPVDRLEQFTRYTDKFVAIINKVGAQTVLYETWARHPTHSIYRQHSKLSSIEQMVRHIQAVFRTTSTRVGAQLAPVGTAFYQAMSNFPDIVLHRPDGSHPSYSGSYLAACILFGVITDQDPQTSSYHPYEVPPAEAEILRQVASRVLAQGEGLASSRIEIQDSLSQSAMRSNTRR